jgi:hypothetical protein
MRFAAAALLACLFQAVSGLSVSAQTTAPATIPPLPSTHDATTDSIIRTAVGLANDIIARNRENAANSARGTVNYFRRYEMQVEIGPNAYRDVHLHPGTVIYPRGATPGDGAAVQVSGRGQADGSLVADSITVLR